MEPAGVYKTIIVLLLCSLFFLGGIYFENSKENKQESKQQDTFELPTGEFQPEVLLGNLTPQLPPPTQSTVLSASGVIESFSSDSWLLMLNTGQNNPRIITIGEKTAVFISTPSATKDQITASANLSLFVLRPGTLADLKAGAQATAFSDEDVENKEQFTATRIVISP